MQQPVNDSMSLPNTVPIVVPTSKVGEESIDRLDQLMSLLMDEEINEAQVGELNDLLLGDPQARERYIEASLLHANLLEFFRGEESDS